MAFTEDLAPFFDVAAGFAVSATLGGVEVQGIFDAATAEAQLGAYGAATRRPRFTLSTAQAGASAVGLALVIAGQGSWVVAEQVDDGTGITVLDLEVA